MQMSRESSDDRPRKEKGRSPGLLENKEGGRELESLEEKESCWRFRANKTGSCSSHTGLVNRGRQEGISSEYDGKALEIAKKTRIWNAHRSFLSYSKHSSLKAKVFFFFFFNRM